MIKMDHAFQNRRERRALKLAEEKTNDALRRFKAFLRKNPQIVAYTRKHNKKWSDVFDDWVIFGESHDIWKSYGVATAKTQEEEKPRSALSWNKIIQTVDKIDTQQWQKRLNNISGALSGIQTLIGQFRQNRSANGPETDGNDGRNRAETPGEHQPFFFRRD